MSVSDQFIFYSLFDDRKKGVSVCLQLGQGSVNQDLDTSAPSANHYCADSGYKLYHQCKMALPISRIFTLISPFMVCSWIYRWADWLVYKGWRCGAKKQHSQQHSLKQQRWRLEIKKEQINLLCLHNTIFNRLTRYHLKWLHYVVSTSVVEVDMIALGG